MNGTVEFARHYLSAEIHVDVDPETGEAWAWVPGTVGLYVGWYHRVGGTWNRRPLTAGYSRSANSRNRTEYDAEYPIEGGPFVAALDDAVRIAQAALPNPKENQ